MFNPSPSPEKSRSADQEALLIRSNLIPLSSNYLVSVAEYIDPTLVAGAPEATQPESTSRPAEVVDLARERELRKVRQTLEDVYGAAA